GMLDLTLRLGVHRTGGLIQDQDRGIQGQSPGKAQKLALPHTQTPPPLAEAVGVSRRQSLDEPVRAHPAGRLPSRFERNRGIEGEIMENVPYKEEEVLLDESNDGS